ncbi:MAG: hypothetical protein ACKVQU_16655 [Burkholderiales bacterium]
MSLFNLPDTVIPALIGAAATMFVALLQLRMTWTKEVLARERGAPVTKKSRRGPVLVISILLIAAAVGGFALSQYLMVQTDRETVLLRDEMQTRLAQLGATADRLERARPSEASLIQAETRQTDDQRRGQEGIVVEATVSACRSREAPALEMHRDCTEQDAIRISLCGGIPAAAVVSEVALYTKPEGSERSWADARVAPGKDLDHARFADKPSEHTDAEKIKRVCIEFVSWDPERARSARVVVKYELPDAPAARATPRAAFVPVTEATP